MACKERGTFGSIPIRASKEKNGRTMEGQTHHLAAAHDGGGGGGGGGGGRWTIAAALLQRRTLLRTFFPAKWDRRNDG